MKHPPRLLLAAATIACATDCGTTTLTHGVPNLVQVDPGVWRSGQPTTAEGWAYLKSLGIRRVVKLNFESEGSDDSAREAGMEVRYLPIQPEGSLASILDAPDPTHIDGAVAALSEGGGVLVHCEHGNDRTGLVVGAYRVKHDGWTKGRAFREMLARGYHVELPALDVYWEDHVR
jgi:tyrosine-protein phosphatase SIW14